MISFIYFDVGGVLIKDFRSSNEFSRLKESIGVKNIFEKEFDELFYEYQHKELCLNRDIDSLIPIFSKKFGIKFPDNYSLLEDFVNRFKKNDSIYSLVYKLKEKIRIGLLTNMYPRMFDLIIKKDLLPHIKWDVIIDSSVVGFQKPDVGIFSVAEEKSGAKKNEILFIDDAQKNIDVANIFGWKTLLYDINNPEKANKLIYDISSELL